MIVITFIACLSFGMGHLHGYNKGFDRAEEMGEIAPHRMPYREMEITPGPKFTLLEKLFMSESRVNHALGFTLIVPFFIGGMIAKAARFLINIGSHLRKHKSFIYKAMLGFFGSMVNYGAIRYFYPHMSTDDKIGFFFTSPLLFMIEVFIGFLIYCLLSSAREQILHDARKKIK